MRENPKTTKPVRTAARRASGAKAPDAAAGQKKSAAGARKGRTAARKPAASRAAAAEKPAKAKPSRAKKTAAAAKPAGTALAQTKAAPKQKAAGGRSKALKIIPIGGLNEIGKNLTALEYDGKIMLIDCGMSFPEDDMLGIDAVIPDFTYLIKNAKKLVGAVITHGHEDHIGGIPFLLKEVNIPIYGTRITLGLIENKLTEHGIKGDLRAIHAGDIINLGPFTVETIRTTHSVADAICLYITTPTATLFHTGDFKIDYTPIDGEPIDLRKFAEIGARGVDIMLADSTNALRPGFTKSERYVGAALDKFFSRAEKRIIIATFSSNVHRVQKIIELTAKYGRKFAVSGRSMEKVVALAQELGYLKIPAGCYVELNQANKVPDEQLVIITTGSQGEPMSALARMANDEHRNVKLKKGDMVILSSTPVPGNEKSVSNVVNKLYDKGAEVIYNEIADIHVSGHACQEELKLIHSLIRPKYFMPVHGEARHLVEHGKLAEELGMKKDHIFVLNNGDQLSLTKRTATVSENVVPAQDILVDGLGIGDVGNVILRDRHDLSVGGLLIVSCTIDKAAKEIVAGPDIVTRGFVYVKENEDLINEARDIAARAIAERLYRGSTDWNDMKNRVREELRKFIYSRMHRNPIILPVFMEI